MHVYTCVHVCGLVRPLFVRMGLIVSQVLAHLAHLVPMAQKSAERMCRARANVLRKKGVRVLRSAPMFELHEHLGFPHPSTKACCYTNVEKTKTLCRSLVIHTHLGPRAKHRDSYSARSTCRSIEIYIR